MTNKFILDYTRDTTLMLQEIWHPPFQSRSKELLGEENPIKPTVINFMSNGALEIWESEESMQWFMDTLLKRNDEEGFFQEKNEKYLELLSQIETYWEKGTLDNLEEFQKYIDLMFEAAKYFTIFYFSSMDERTPEEIKKISFEIRKEDKYFEECDKVIRKTLVNLYPEIKGYETTILSNEISNLPSREEMEKRKKHCIMIGQTLCVAIPFKEFLEKHPELEFEIPEITKQQIETKTLKGQIANKGKVTGIARVIRTKDKIHTLKEGEILIGTMTTPDYINAMKRAAAIVTDEGGITCHAGIVSREFNIPCIIATKVATKFFKTGDKLEVDANTGTVRILNE